MSVDTVSSWECDSSVMFEVREKKKHTLHDILKVTNYLLHISLKRKNDDLFCCVKLCPRITAKAQNS